MKVPCSGPICMPAVPPYRSSGLGRQVTEDLVGLAAVRYDVLGQCLGELLASPGHATDSSKTGINPGAEHPASGSSLPCMAPQPLSFIPSPSTNGFHLGPLFIHFYGLMYVIGITLAVLITQRRVRNAGGNSDSGRRCRPVGGPGRHHRRPDLLRHHHAEPDPARLVRRVRGLVGRPWHLGRHRRRSPGRGLAGTPGRPERRAVRRRRRPGPAGRPGRRPDRQLLQPGTVRPPDHAAVGAGNPDAVPAAWLRPLRHVPADVPVRADLGSAAGRRS